MTFKRPKILFLETLTFDLGIDAPYAGYVIDVVYASMSNKGRYYHNVNHIHNMVKRGYELFGYLTSDDLLAILFHDVVYNPLDTSSNEINSVAFMDSVLSYYYIGNRRLYEDAISARQIIRDTGRHTKFHVEDNSLRVLDLDLIDFSDWKKCLRNNDKIYNEYINMKWVCDNQYKNQRNEFLKTLISKGFLYRTEICKNKFEDKAMKNIERLINE